MEQFESGAGVVTAQVTNIGQSPSPTAFEPAVPITLTIKSIDARPLVNNFDLKPGDSVMLRLADEGCKVGDVCQLFIRYNSGTKEYEPTPGENVTPLKQHAISGEILARLRDLAARAPGERVRACRQFAADSKANDMVRIEALKQLESRDRFNSGDNIAEAAETLAVLKQAWHDAPFDMSDLVRQELDWTLRVMDRDFADSAERVKFWMSKAFSPIATVDTAQSRALAFAQGEIVRNTLRDIAFDNVSGVRDELFQRAADKNLSLYIRARVAGVLQGAWLLDKEPDARCLSAAEDVYVQALGSDDSEIVLIATDQILDGLKLRTPYERASRHYSPGKSMRQSLESAVPRMEALEREFARSNDSYRRGRTSLAITELQDAIRALPSIHD